MATAASPKPRTTRQGQWVLEGLEKSDGFISAQQLHTTLLSQGKAIGLATVYNRLRVLADAHRVDVLHSDSGEALYRRCDVERHHHHLRCRHCGSVQEVESPEVETWAHSLAEDAGFRDITHTIEITGVCEDCHG